MGDNNTAIAPNAVGSTMGSSVATHERAPLSQRSHSDPATSTLSRGFSASLASSSSTKEQAKIEEFEEEEAIEDDEDIDQKIDAKEEDEEDVKPMMKKRHSSSGHANVYTECGRHGDDWLFGGITDTVKSVFGKSAKK